MPGRLVALISPHAGLRYSGPVAAHAYALLRGRRDLTAVLVGPSHRTAFEGVSVYARGAFATPLGEIPVDEEVAAALLDGGRGTPRRPARRTAREHSLEMQLPFLQHLVPGLRIVPLLMGSQTRGRGGCAGRTLWPGPSKAATRSWSRPATSATIIRRRWRTSSTRGSWATCERFDPEGLMDRLESLRGHACGGGPMVAVLKAARARGADRATVLRYADSGDAGEGDKSRVVGYLAAALSAAGPA